MGNPFLLIAVFAVCLIAYQLLTRNRRKLKNIRQEWETGTYIALHEDFQSVSSYWKNKKEHAEFYAGVDQITWDDLAMDQVFKKINYTKSSVGSEYLFNQLHDIDPKFEGLQSKEELYKLVEKDEKLRERVLLILSNLGKRNYANSSSYFYNFNDHKIKFAYLYAFLACVPLISISLMFLNLTVGIISLIGSLVINALVYYRNKNALDNDLHSITYAAAIINTGESLASIRHPQFSIYDDILKKEGKGLKRVSFFGKVLSIGTYTGGDFDIFFRVLPDCLLARLHFL